MAKLDDRELPTIASKRIAELRLTVRPESSGDAEHAHLVDLSELREPAVAAGEQIGERLLGER